MGSAAAGLFGGSTGIFRLLQSSLGDQAGWLLGFAVVAGLAVADLLAAAPRRPPHRLADRGRRRLCDQRDRVQLCLGIFHPYYVSFLAPFSAALIGAGVGRGPAGGPLAPIVAPLAIAAGAVTELVVLGTLGGSLSWAKPLVIGPPCRRCRLALLDAVAAARAARARRRAGGPARGAATWAAETLGHATSGTFPTGGPASALAAGGFGPGGRRPGGRAARAVGALAGPRAVVRGGSRRASGRRRRLGGPARGPGGRVAPAAFAAVARQRRFGGGGGSGRPRLRRRRRPGGFGADTATLNAAIAYAKAHGGGTIGVSSQSSAAAAIVLRTPTSRAWVASLAARALSAPPGSRWRSGTAAALGDRRLDQDFRAPGDTRHRQSRPRWRCRQDLQARDGPHLERYDDHHVRLPQGVQRRSSRPRRNRDHGDIVGWRWRSALVAALAGAPSALARRSQRQLGRLRDPPDRPAVPTVTGSWTEPSATCVPGSPSFSSDWVGLGGYSDELAGARADRHRGRLQRRRTRRLDRLVRAGAVELAHDPPAGLAGGPDHGERDRGRGGGHRQAEGRHDRAHLQADPARLPDRHLVGGVDRRGAVGVRRLL